MTGSSPSWKLPTEQKGFSTAAGGTGLAGAAAHCLSHLSLPFTSAFDLNLFQRKAQESTEPLFQ